ncbi:ATP-binding protein [Variovorax sp. M-6]|uniref:ATP-binding protein n=1 Tax=Variovorax sp. M-6 TaxID=3233041 RepID=UPI003F9DBA58
MDRIACGAELANLPALLALVAATCRREQIDDPTCDDLQLIVEEACVNVMHHAYPAGQGGPLTLEVRIVDHGGPRRIVLTLEDRGRPFDPLSAAPVDVTAAIEARAPGGLGVHLIRQLSDRQHYQRHPLRGNVFTMEKYLVLPSVQLAARPILDPDQRQRRDDQDGDQIERR